MNKLRTGDEVIVISGKDKGRTGTITKFLANDKCEVSGIKIVKKHQKPNPQANTALPLHHFDNLYTWQWSHPNHHQLSQL